MVREKLDLRTLPPAVRAVADALRTAGGRCWLAGGSVRDHLLGRATADHDLATDLPPGAVAAALPDADARDAALGAVRCATEAGDVVVTTLRTEADYGHDRRPAKVEFVRDLAADARRRDFTVNALYADFADGALRDPTGGIDDLAAKVLRAIGDPAVRFAEDPLRLLRALRFAARFGFAFDPATATAARAAAPLLRRLSAERVFTELTTAFTGDGRGRALRLLVELGFAAELLPEIAAMDGVTQPPQFHPEGDVLTHTALVLDEVPGGDPGLAWAAVLHDVGKPPTWRRAEDRIRFDGHDVLSARMAAAILDRLRAPQALRDEVVEIARDHIRFASLPSMRPRRRERWLRAPSFPRHLAFHLADCRGSHGMLDIHAFARAALEALPPVPPPPLVTGADALALGVPEGPMVGRLLRAVEQALDDRQEPPTREDALVLLRELAARSDQDGPSPGR